MATHSDISRRSFMQGTAAAAGLALAGRGRIAHAQAVETPHLLVVFTRAGFNAILASANSFVTSGYFGVTNSNILQVGGTGLFIDKPSFGAFLPAVATANMASIGVNHLISSHNNAKAINLNFGTSSFPIALAAAMGGNSSLKYVKVGPQPMDTMATGASGGVSNQVITDVGSTIAALGGSVDPNLPDRALALKGLKSAGSMSAGRISASPNSLVSVQQGYVAAIDTLSKAPQSFDAAALNTAYGLPATQTAVDSWAAQMMGAELMIRAGTNVVFVAPTLGFDTHNDITAVRVRNMMTQLSPALGTFLSRTMTLPGKNVVTLLLGDFARTNPGSQHQPNLSAVVIGKHVKTGTTGHVANNVSLTNTTLPTGASATKGMWAYVAGALQLATKPFGVIPAAHAALLK